MNKTHPLAAPGQATIALFTKGRQASIIRDSFLLMKQAVSQLGKGESVLYINTLTSAAAVNEVVDKIARRYRREVTSFSSSSRRVMERLDFLGETIGAKNVKLVIINSFEFAAMHSRQRVKLANWMREMRDLHGVRVAVYSMYAEQKAGALGTLAWLADRTQEVGEWQYENEKTLSVQEGSLAAAQEFSAMLDSSSDDGSEETYYVDRPEGTDMFRLNDILCSPSLKNKDLASVAARSESVEEFEEEEELELEMA